MRKLKFAHLLFVFLTQTTNAQPINLVPNYSFENHINCPSAPIDPLTMATDWVEAEGSPDYFNQLITNCVYVGGVSNSFGYQMPFEGNAYMGFAFMKYGPPNGGLYREWIQAQLNTTLIANKKYCVSFNVSLATNCQYSSDAIGAYFSDTAIFFPDPFIEFPSQINNPQGNFITDTVNWTLISGIMTAQGGENYITIGDFKNNTHTTMVSSNPGSNQPNTYYYLDVVSVIQLPDINAGNSDTICIGGTRELNGSCTGCWAGLQYRWYPSTGLSDTTVLHPMAHPTQTTTYYFGLIDTTGTVICMADNVDSVTVYVGCSGVNELKEESLKFELYPNPTNSNLYIESDLQNAIFTITDILGKEIKQIKTDSKKTSIDISDIENGVYFINLIDKNNFKKCTKRFVVCR